MKPVNELLYRGFKITFQQNPEMQNWWYFLVKNKFDEYFYRKKGECKKNAKKYVDENFNSFEKTGAGRPKNKLRSS